MIRFLLTITGIRYLLAKLDDRAARMEEQQRKDFASK